MLGNFSSADFFQRNSFKDIITLVSNGLDPDQDRRSVGPDLGPNSHSLQCYQQMT